MNLPAEFPPQWKPVFDALSGPSMFWLVDVQNRTKAPNRRQPMYDQFPGIRRSGVYVIRDVQGPPNLFYVGMVKKDALDGVNTNDRADGIIGRLSAHRNMHGRESHAMERWWDYTHPDDPMPEIVTAGWKDRVRAAARDRLGVTFGVWLQPGVKAIEDHVIDDGLPGAGLLPILNDENWKHRSR